MKLSIGTILIMVALFSECYFKTAAIPMTKADETEPDLQGLSESLEENSLRSSSGNSRIIVVADSNLLRTLMSLNKGVPHLSLPESLLSTERRDVDSDLSPSIAIIRRDTMRCMVGKSVSAMLGGVGLLGRGECKLLMTTDSPSLIHCCLVRM